MTLLCNDGAPDSQQYPAVEMRKSYFLEKPQLKIFY